MIPWLAAALGLGAPGLALPLYAHDEPCADPRFPAVAGGWLFSCDAQGRVAQALRLDDGHAVALPVAVEQPAVGPGCIYVPGVNGGLWRLGDGAPEAVGAVALVVEPLAAPPVTDCAHIALLTDNAVQAFAVGDRVRRSVEARPAGWYPPALAWPWVAWIEAPRPGERVLMAYNVESGERRAGPGVQGARHVIGRDGLFAWADDAQLWLWEPMSQAARATPAEAGFSAPLSLDRGVICYEERQAGHLDLRCTDGLAVQGPGHQRAPQRSGDRLLYREDDRLMLYTAPR